MKVLRFYFSHRHVAGKGQPIWVEELGTHVFILTELYEAADLCESLDEANWEPHEALMNTHPAEEQGDE